LAVVDATACAAQSAAASPPAFGQAFAVVARDASGAACRVASDAFAGELRDAQARPLACELAFAEHMVLMVYTDRPGIVAVYGKAFADANVNIAAMQIARQQKGGKALSVVTVDSPIDPKVLEKLKKDIDASTMKAITISVG
jgi:predicted amino acid-binding ACT domain protein